VCFRTISYSPSFLLQLLDYSRVSLNSSRIIFYYYFFLNNWSLFYSLSLYNFSFSSGFFVAGSESNKSKSYDSEFE
jgi:hypothetical protein